MFKPIPPRSKRFVETKKTWAFNRTPERQPDVKVEPVFSNLQNPQVQSFLRSRSGESPVSVAKAPVKVPEKRYSFFDGKNFLACFIVPVFIFRYRAYVGFRASRLQTKIARKKLAKLALASFAVTLAFYGAFAAWNADEMLAFNYRNFFSILIPFTIILNVLVEINFAIQNVRAWFVPKNKRKKFKAENGLGIDAQDQIKAIAANRWRVDFLACSASLDFEEFPDDLPSRSCIGAEGFEWKWILFDDERFEKHFAIFGDLGYGLVNLFRALIKALCGEKDCALVFVDSDNSRGLLSFSKFESLPNAALAVGLNAAYRAINQVWHELKFRESEFTFKDRRDFFRIGLVLDNGCAAAAYGFWKKKLATPETLTLRREIAAKLSEIIDKGKALGIQVVALMENDVIHHQIFEKMRDRFEAIAVHFSRVVPLIDSGVEVKQTIKTNDVPYRDVATILWGMSNIAFKVPHIATNKFFCYLKERSSGLKQPTKDFLSRIKTA